MITNVCIYRLLQAYYSHKLIYSYYFYSFRLLQEFGIRFHTGAIKAASTCYGTLTIKHADENDISRVKELNLSPIGGHKRDGAYPKIKKGFPILKKNIVIKLIRNGDCCWEIYEKPYFRGEKQYLGHSENYPDIQPESLKKVDCRAS